MVNVRPITNEDFSFVQKLAAEEKSFTVPSDYILWVLTQRLYPDVCLVAVSSDGEPIGYLLGLINDLEGVLFIWQVAVTHRGGKENASITLLEEVKRVVKARGLKRISFTMQPRVARLWGYRASKQVLGVFPEQGGPGINGEPEYFVSVE